MGRILALFACLMFSSGFRPKIALAKRHKGAPSPALFEITNCHFNIKSLRDNRENAKESDSRIDGSRVLAR